ncbi:Checkpoint protein [Parasponia andersonii]|uniref:Checkpoint protein n=1 Tax=Parasponia andersonii TaxID=3476 RepID=A0A2P5BDY1_PARAD|nr:Checkpoint protein [Parasponia andersonii]
MDNSPDSPQDLSPSNLQPPERRCVRRRLVQATLFPHKPQPHNREVNGDLKGENACDGIEDGKDEECCGSQSQSKSKSKSKRKPKGTSTTPEKASGKVKGKRSGNTPKKNLIKALNEEATVVIPDLRQEARMMAEENSRMFAGRKLHPFFSSWKEGKKNHEVIDLEANRRAVGRDNREMACGPIHVFERSQDTEVPLDWRTWTFSEEIFTKSACYNVSSDQCFTQQECVKDTLPTENEKMVCNGLLKYAEDSEMNKADSFNESTALLRKPDIGKESKFFEERMKSYYLCYGNQPKNSLWTYSYQPKNAMEVCGNDESVKFLSGWLKDWRERGFQISKELIGCDTSDMQDNDYVRSESDSDSESKCEEDRLKNVLLVTGPIGVNASECRNGALVKQKFGEALESRQLKRSLVNPRGGPNKYIVKPSTALANGAPTQEFDGGVIEVITLSDEDCHNATGESGISGREEAGSCYHQSEVKTLILFEDVDITFLEDRGFIAAVQQIAETAKGPIILTSDSHSPLLPDNLDRLQICFTPPSPEEMICHVNMVCAVERANIQPHLLEQIIAYCQGDIRKTIMHLQFWCQGRSSGKVKKIQRLYSSLLFDHDAGHQILPKLFPWDLPSQLSEQVDKEITESLCREENSNLMDVIKEEELDKKEIPYGFRDYNNNCKTESIEEKKATMLSRNCSVYDYEEFRTQLGTAHELSDNLDDPFSCVRQNVRKKHDVVSSDSEDEFVDNGCTLFLDEDTNSEALLERSPLLKELPGSAAAEADEKHYHHSETVGCIPINDECKSFDVSCVPESSFVPETEINDGMELDVTVSCGYVGDTLEEVSLSNRLPVEAINLVISKPEIQQDSETLVNNQYAIAELCQQEEVEDSQNHHVEAVSTGYQVLDESSRMDCSRISKFVEKHKPLVIPDLVQHSWNKLRRCHADLTQYVRSEEQHALQIVQLAHKVSNLISETDVLLSDCQQLTTDCLEPSVIPSEESDACSFYDKCLFASTTAQHGFCFYAKDIAAVGSTMGSVGTVDFASEMLGFATGSMQALGKLDKHDMARSRTTWTGRNSELIFPKTDISFQSENKSCLVDIVQSVVPPKSLMALKGAACYEYLSSLRCISKSEASRLSEDNVKPRKRRRRIDRHYLSTGTQMLSPDEISSLGQIKACRENSSQCVDAV